MTEKRQTPPAWRGVSPRVRDSVRSAAAPVGDRERPRGLVRSLALVIVPSALLLLSGVAAGPAPASGEIERGVSVAGIEVGGIGRQQAVVAMSGKFDAFLSEPLSFTVDGRVIEVLPEALGVALDAEATYEQALQVGRGNFFAAGAERLGAHTRGRDLDPVYTYDPDRLTAFLQGLSGDLVTAPTDARFEIVNGRLEVRSSIPGTGIDTSAIAGQLGDCISGLESAPIEIEIVSLDPTVTTADLQAVGEDAATILREQLVLTDGSQNWQITPEALAGLLTAKDGNLALDTRALEPIVATLSTSIDREPSDAAIVTASDGTFVIQPEVVAATLNVRASVAKIEQAILDGEHRAELVLTQETPSIVASEIEPMMQRANEIVGRGMIVSWPDGEQALDPSALAAAITFDIEAGAISFDHDSLFATLEPIAYAINRPSSGYRWKDWEIVAPEGALPGRVVDITASIGVITSSALNGQSSSLLVVQEENDPAAGESGIVINELLGTASTYYGNASYNKRTNVEVAVAALDGVLIRPGGTFSFNNAIGGTATLEDGYTVGFGIVAGEDGLPRTVPSIAGGICQVATTAFQAAFWSGMPIGARNWHLYWIPAYGSGPGGLKGLDATVDPDYGPDFTFHNPTDQWLAVNAVADGEWLTVELWGTSQGWTVQVDDPEIYNVIKADPTPVRQPSDHLEPGQEVVAEHAEDGFAADIHRTVVDADGNVVDDITLTSYYRPSRNVTLVGPGVPLESTTPSAPETSPSKPEADTTTAETDTMVDTDITPDGERTVDETTSTPSTDVETDSDSAPAPEATTIPDAVPTSESTDDRDADTSEDAKETVTPD